MANEDPKYQAWLRRQPCSAPHEGLRVCWRRSEVHHATGAGMALKSHDHEAICVCRLHHQNLHDFEGKFKGWTREQRREWHTEVARQLRLKWQAEQDREGVFCEVVMDPEEVL